MTNISHATCGDFLWRKDMHFASSANLYCCCRVRSVRTSQIGCNMGNELNKNDYRQNLQDTLCRRRGLWVGSAGICDIFIHQHIYIYIYIYILNNTRTSHGFLRL